MATKEGTWRTWAGSRSDITRAVRETADALTEWSDYPALVEATVTYANDLTEPLVGLDSLEEIYATDLPGIRSLWIEIRPDRDAYYAEGARLLREHQAQRQRQFEEYWAERDRLIALWRQAADDSIGRGEVPPGRPDEPTKPEEPPLAERPPLVAASVLLRIPWAGRGLRIEVTGPDRHQVVGLFDRLSEILTRRQAFRRFDRDYLLWSFGLLVGAGLILGNWIPRAAGLAERNGRWELAEIIGPVAGTIIPVVVAAGLWWLYPPFEILNANEKTRAERFAKVFWASVGAIVTGLIVGAIWSLAD